MLQSKTIVGDISPHEMEEGAYGSQIGLEHELYNLDSSKRPLRRGLRGMKLHRQDVKDLESLSEQLDNLTNSQLTHHSNRIKEKFGYTGALVKDPTSQEDWLKIRRSANKNYVEDVHKFQPTTLEKPI